MIYYLLTPMINYYLSIYLNLVKINNCFIKDRVDYILT